MPPRGIDRPETVIVPKNQVALLAELQRVIPPKLHRRKIDGSIRKILTSIAHKLTVAMYQAALVCEVEPKDFLEFDNIERYSLTTTLTSLAIYKQCQFSMENIHEYRVFLTFFLETFSATAFSLFDVCGHLLNELYDLGMNAKNVSFYKVTKDLSSKSIHSLLSKYLVGGPTSVSWIHPLKQIRNTTTHRTITDICRFTTTGDLYSPATSTESFLDSSFFPSGARDIKLCDFVKDVFLGLDKFVEDFYEQLTQALKTITSLPIP